MVGMTEPAKPKGRRPRREARPAPPAFPGFRQIGELMISSVSRDIPWNDKKAKTPLLVDLEWSVIDGRAEPVQITIRSHDRDRPITAEIVRRVPIGGIVTDERATRRAAFVEALTMHSASQTDTDRDEIAVAVEQHSRDVELNVVADVYRAAFDAGESVQRAVRDRFELKTLSGAAKKIAAARAAGYLGPATGTKAGERNEGQAR